VPQPTTLPCAPHYVKNNVIVSAAPLSNILRTGCLTVFCIVEFILWHADPLLGNDRETSNYTTLPRHNIMARSHHTEHQNNQELHNFKYKQPAGAIYSNRKFKPIRHRLKRRPRCTSTPKHNCSYYLNNTSICSDDKVL
jgi:hypothetical protein